MTASYEQWTSLEAPETVGDESSIAEICQIQLWQSAIKSAASIRGEPCPEGVPVERDLHLHSQGRVLDAEVFAGGQQRLHRGCGGFPVDPQQQRRLSGEP